MATDVVLDASALVHASIVPAGMRVFEGLVLHAPSLIWSETASALRQLEFRADLQRGDVDAAIERALVAPIRIHPSTDVTLAAVALARELGWAKTYDAEYLALARLLGFPLMTTDARLAAAVSRLVQVLTPNEL